MAKTKAQETESKGKAIDGEDPTEARLSKLEEMFTEHSKMFTEQNKKIEKMFLLMNNSMAQKVLDEQSSLEQVVQKSSQEKENRSGDSGFSRENKGVDQGQERGDNHRAYKAITRMGKIDFPRFDGTMFKTWVFKAEQFFGIDHTPEDLKVKMAAIHFDDEACNWHKSFIEDGEDLEFLYDWKGYVELLRERFEDDCEDPMAELKVLKETDGIMDYHKKFESIKVRVKLSEAHLMSAYLAGLRTDTQMHVRMFKPQTVRHCFYLGKTYEKAYPKKQLSANLGPREVNSVSYSRSSKDVEIRTDPLPSKGAFK